jgi:hypothetical protein
LKGVLNHIKDFCVPLRLVGILVVLFFVNTSGFAQDRKPINNKRQIRETRSKSVKRKEQATTRDIAGRKLRTRNQSTAQRAVYTAQSPYRAKRRSGDQVGQPIGGAAPRVRSRSAEAARANVYPQKGPFVNNASRKPEQSYSNKRELSRLNRLQTRQEPPGKKRRVIPRSNSQAYLTRGRKNVYWGKYSKGERAITTDITGRPLRTKNFRTPPNAVIRAEGPYAGRRPGGDRAYSGSFRSGYKTASRRGELPWKGDISGQPLRRSKGRDNQVAGKPGSAPRIEPGFSARYMREDLNKLRGIKPVKGGGGSVSGKLRSNQPISARAPGMGASYMRKDLNRLKGIKPIKGGGGSISGRQGVRNAPLGAKGPGNPRIADMQANYKGNLRREEIAFSQQGLSYPGNVRAERKMKGGGSVSARMKRNNNNAPIPVRQPQNQRIAGFQVNYKGYIKRNRAEEGFSQEGLSYAGNMKARRLPKGGGSVSGSWNNQGRPIPGKSPGEMSTRVSKFQGNLKQEPKAFSQSGYGYAGDIRMRPKTYSQEGLDFTGYQKTKKPLKGGGSVSGRLWNNNNQPIPGKTPGDAAGKIDKYQGNIPQFKKTYSQEGLDFTGYQKTKKPLKGGGSVSGRLWNNNNQPIPGKTPGDAASKIDKYQGNIPFVRKSFNQEGYDFSGYLKTKKPEKGGGSVSGRLWNNNGEPIPVRTPTGDEAGDINYSGKTRLPRFKREYVRNPNAVEQALKKHRPYENVYQVNGLMVSVKQKETEQKPKAVKGALPGVPPSKETVKASEYSRSIKMYWAYKHNPSSSNDAQMTIKYSKSFEDATEFAGKTRLSRNYRHNPNSNKEALKVIAPARAYARIGDYQGNIKMSKYNEKKHFVDAQFAHQKGNNVKGERTIFTNAKLIWANLFKKNSIQPDAVKDKERRPRYDKKEKELWKDLYD